MTAKALIRGRWALLVLVLASAATFLLITSSARGATPDQLRRGRAIFERVWDAGGFGATNDGLGPMYNERSCVACHFLGGIGGAGTNKNNVELLTAAVQTNSDEAGKTLKRVGRVHPSFNTGATAILHRYSTDKHYPIFRQGVLGILPPTDEGADPEIFDRAMRTYMGNDPVKNILTREHDLLLLSQRSTTPMFGAGLIDKIPSTVLEAIAVNQPKHDPDVKGRLVGRFGWRGQIGTLKDFVLGACAVELGLSVPGHSQAINPLKVPPPPVEQPGATIANVSAVPFKVPVVQPPLDLTQAECDDLIAFIASLPPPRRLPPDNPQELALVKNGEAVFASTGCALCHQPRLEHVAGVYSDLLLHDMGPLLDDPSPAPVSLSPSSQYYGGGALLAADVRRREWKTPPLWGLRDSGPYLHDGRAKTVNEAILLHGGEARGSVSRYRSLSNPDRRDMLVFLSKLAAPVLDGKIIVASARNARGP